MGTMTAPVGPAFLNVPLDVLVNRDLDKNGRDFLETLHKTSAATSSTVSADMLLEPASKKQKLQSEPPVDSAEAALLRAGRKKPPWTPTEQAVVAIKHCELGNRWTQIAAYLPLRSENDVKNIWHSTLRCKDTQKRSFLRTYALGVHDHAYDYATRKTMFDVAVRQCGPPPPQAAEMIARVQLLMDHPELQAAVQQQHLQQQEQQLLQAQQHQQNDQLAQLTQLLQKRDDLPHHQHPQLAHLAHLAQLQSQYPHLLMQYHDSDGQQQEGEEAAAATASGGGGGMDTGGDLATELRKASSATAVAAGRAAAVDKGMLNVRRLLSACDKLSGKYDDAYDDTYTFEDRAAAEEDEAMISELEQQQRMQGGAAGLRNQAQNADLDAAGAVALQRYGAAAATQGQGGSSDGGAAGGDSLPAALANMAAAVVAEPQAGGDAPAGANRPPGMPLPALGNLLALLYKYNIEQTHATAKPLGGPSWSPNRGEAGEEGEGAAAAAAGPESPKDAIAAGAAAPAEGEEERGGAKAAGGAGAPVPTAGMAGAQGPQSLTLLPLALRPLAQPKREREADVRMDEEDAGAEGAPTSGEASADGSPKRPASIRVAARRAQAAAAAAAAATAAPSMPTHNGAAVAAGGQLRSRGSMPYTLQDADADELGAVEALALAARLNTSGGRTAGATAPSPSGRPTGSNGNLAAGAGNGSGEVHARVSNTGATAAAPNAGGPRNGAIVAATAASTPGPRPVGPANSNGSSGLDLHARQLPPPPVAAPALPPPPPPPPRSLMRLHSSDLHPSSLQRQQQQQQQRSTSQTLDVISVLNMPGLRRQVLSLPAQTLVALLCSPMFGSDAEASVLLLVALWLQNNKDKVTSEQGRAVCGAVRLAALGGFYLSAVLPQLMTDPWVASAAAVGKTGVAANARPGGRWFELRSEELAFLTRYVHAGAAERALLVDVARGVYDCSLPWYDMTPRYLSSPAEGFSFEWHIPEQGLRDALASGTQPHAAFTVNDDITDADGGAPDGNVAVVPYILCRGLEWHVFVDCQQQRRGGGATGPTGAGSSSVAGVFVYCRVPAALRAPGASAGGFVGVVPGAGIRLGVHGWRCGRLEEVFVWTFGDETYFVPDAGMGCPSALPLRKRPTSPAGGAGGGPGRGAGGAAADSATSAWADYLHEGGLRGTLTFLPH